MRAFGRALVRVWVCVRVRGVCLLRALVRLPVYLFWGLFCFSACVWPCLGPCVGGCAGAWGLLVACLGASARVLVLGAVLP